MEMSRKVLMHSEDFACSLCRAEKKTRTSFLLLLSRRSVGVEYKCVFSEKSTKRASHF